jgi:hypothetical protein
MALYTMPELRRRAATFQNSYRIRDDMKKLAATQGQFDIFLSQRQLDAEVVKVLYDDITAMGYRVYVDWITDQELDRTRVNSETAEALRKRLRDAKCLLYVATAGSTDSKWMPWELGFKDGHSKKVAILPIAASDVSSDSYRGQEYLGLYPYVSQGFTNHQKKLWVHTDENTYVMLDSWLNGATPYRRLTSTAHALR